MAVFLCLSLPLQAFLLKRRFITTSSVISTTPIQIGTPFSSGFPNVADPNIRAIPFFASITNGIFFIFLHGGINDMLHLSPIPGINTVHDQITGRLLPNSPYSPLNNQHVLIDIIYRQTGLQITSDDPPTHFDLEYLQSYLSYCGKRIFFAVLFPASRIIFPHPPAGIRCRKSGDRHNFPIRPLSSGRRP